MKKLRLFIIGILSLLVFPGFVNAANANISIKTSGQAVVGNTVTATVTLSSGSGIGAWQWQIGYDQSILKLESGDISVADYASNGGGIKSKSYTLKFKVLKSGSASINVGSYLVYAMEDDSAMSVSTSNATVKCITQAELEASYSDNAYLKALTVGEYELTPGFNKNTYEYNVLVPNEVETVKVSATKEHSAASVSGTGDITLAEGMNKVEVVVTAQKGNKLTYVLNIERKELDPIIVKVDNNEYTIVRRADALPEYKTFAPSTLMYEETEIPCLSSEATGYKLIGLKDSDGNILMYIYDNGIKGIYNEITSNALLLFPSELKKSDKFKNYQVIKLDEFNIEAYALNKKSENVVVYAQNIETGKFDYYIYNKTTKSFILYEDELTSILESNSKKYKLVIFGELGIIILLVLILVIKFVGNKNKKKKKVVNEIAEIKIEKEDKKANKKEEVKKEPKKKKKKDEFDF